MKKKRHFCVYLAAAVTVLSLAVMVFCVGRPQEVPQAKPLSVNLGEKFDMFFTNTLSDALDGVLAMDKVYWLKDEDLVAPKPNPACYGETTDPGSLGWLLEEAAELLDGQETIFSTDVEIFPGSKVKYYLDDTIFAITWKHPVETCMFTFAEVKIAHPSQFRRFLAGGEYASGKFYTTSEMGGMVNAVLTSSGDYYTFRPFGITVYEGQVRRFGGMELDTCFIDDKGDLHFTKQETFTAQEEVQQFVDDNNIRFSLAFGPILIQDGKLDYPPWYPIGSTNEQYSRAALCQQGELHYVIVTANMENSYRENMITATFSRNLLEMGITKAYSLDGGQTAVIDIGGEMMNPVDFGWQREISDIIYFATAIPDGN